MDRTNEKSNTFWMNSRALTELSSFAASSVPFAVTFRIAVNTVGGYG